MSTSYEILGDRAIKPCAIEEAHGVGILLEHEGFDFEYVPFRHPTLLDDEVRIRVTDSGICHSDISIMKDTWKMSTFPLIPGHEIIGVVTAVGEKVTKVQVGDRVGHGPQSNCCINCNECSECRLGFNNTCPQSEFTVGLGFGGWATSFQSKAKSFFKIREEIPGSAAPLLCAGLTVYSPLSRDLVPGMKVGVLGLGGLGHLGVMYANRMGCEVVAISTSPDKEAEARALGAQHFLNSRNPEDLKKYARSLDYVLDTATAYSLDLVLPLLRPRGVVNVVGAPDGVPGGPDGTFFNAMDAIPYNLTIKGSAAGSRVDMENMLNFSALHKIFPKSEVYRFDQGKEAIDLVGKGIPRGPRYRAVFETESYFKTFTPSN